MTEPIQFKTVEGGRNLDLKSPVLTDADLIPCVAEDDPIAAARAIAETAFHALNAGARAEAAARAHHLTSDAEHEQKVASALQADHRKSVGAYAETPSRANGATRMSGAERITSWIFVLARFGLIGVTIFVMAIYLRASGYSVDLSSSWPMALAFGFPVLIASYAISMLAEVSDDLAVKRRIAWTLTWLGSLVLLVWVSCSAQLFAFDTSVERGFQVSFGSNAGATPTTSGLDALFPNSAVGVVLLLTHVLADVLLSAACGVWSKVVGLRGRRTVYSPRSDFTNFGEMLDAQTTRRTVAKAQLDYIAGLEAEYEAGLARAVTVAQTRVAALKLRVDAQHLTARANAINDLMKQA